MKAIEEIVREQQEFFKKGKTYSYEFRKEQLDKLRTSIKSHEQELLDALKKDLNKPAFEAYGTEIGLVLDELSFVRRHLKKWMKPERVHTSLVNFPSKSRIFKDPYGVALIMSPWNYPVLLTLDPLIGAIAAGNCAAVKPSNYSPNVSALIKKMLEEIYPAEYVSVIEGGREANQSLLSQKFDYIFFTGSVKVGKLVMESASHNLTPVSLELGGKSPCIVDDTALYEEGIGSLSPSYSFVMMVDMERMVEQPETYVRLIPNFFFRQAKFFRHFILSIQFTCVEEVVYPNLVLLYKG